MDKPNDLPIAGEDGALVGEDIEEALEAAEIAMERHRRSIEEAVITCADWYDDDKEAKSFYVDEMKECWKLYKGDHWDLIGPDGHPLRSATQQMARPNSVENITFSLIEGLASEFAQEVELVDYPVEPGDDEKAKEITNLKTFLMSKNKIVSERIKYLRNFFLYGTAIWDIYWDPDWRGGKGPNRWIGDIRWRSQHPVSIVPDARCKDDINEGERCHKVTWRTLESVKRRYGVKLEEQIMDTDDMIDDMLNEEGEGGRNNFKENQIPVIETWYFGQPLINDTEIIIREDGTEEEVIIEAEQEDGLHAIWWAGESERKYLKHANYVYFDPGETPKFPFIVKQCYPREGSVWGYGEAHFLLSPQIARNKTAEIIMEGHMHHALGQTYYQDGTLSKKQEKIIQEKGTIPGMWFPVQDINGIKREYSQGVPGSLPNEMNRNQSVMETIIGRFDISQGKTPGNIIAFRAIAELSARAQVRLKIKELTIQQSYIEAGEFVNRLIDKYYTEHRRYRIRGDDRYEHNKYNRDDMLNVYDSSTGATIPFNQFNPGVMPGEDLSADRYEVFFPDFDVYVKTSTVAPSDRFYNIDIAKELLTSGLITPQIFISVLEDGKFPPFKELKEELDQRDHVTQILEGMPDDMKSIMQEIQPGEISSLIAQSIQAVIQQPQQPEQMQQQLPDQQQVMMPEQMGALPQPQGMLPEEIAGVPPGIIPGQF